MRLIYKGGKNMKFEIRKVSDVNYQETIEINTLEELMEIGRKYNEPLIIDENTIKIYDGYIE